MMVARQKKFRSKSRGPNSNLPQWDFDLDAPISIVAFGAKTPILALGDGTIRFLTADDNGPESIAAHSGAILCGALDENANGIFTGGDDGRLVYTGTDGRSECVAATEGHWIEHVAVYQGGALAWSHGRMVELSLTTSDDHFSFDLPSSCGGLAFEPNGKRLAAAHYGGATLANLDDGCSERERLHWKGSHIALSWSPDGRFLITSMQEAALHVWRLADKTDLHMRGYPAKPWGLSWSSDHSHLATTGAPGALTWRFDGEDGPEGRNAKMLAEWGELSTAVAWHPTSPVLAVGFRNGLVLLAEPSSANAPALRIPDGDAINGLAWNSDGRMLVWGTESGSATLVDLSKVKQADE